MASPPSSTHSSTHVALSIEVWCPGHLVPCLPCPPFQSLWLWLSWRSIGPGAGAVWNAHTTSLHQDVPSSSLKLMTEVRKSLQSSIEDLRSPRVSNFLRHNLVIPVPSTLRQCLPFTKQVNFIYHGVYFREQEKCISRTWYSLSKGKFIFLLCFLIWPLTLTANI